MNPSALGKDFDFSASLNGSNLESARLTFTIEGAKVNLYKTLVL